MALVLVLVLVTAPAGAQQALSVELGTGVPFNLPLPLTIMQSGQPDITLSARYASEPFVVPIYWVWRIDLWSGRTAWGIEAVHHKLYLENRPPEVREFSISHGLNTLTVVRTWMAGDLLLRVGGGVVLAHPENTVRGKTLSEDGGIGALGYYLTGPTISAAAGTRLAIGGGFMVRLQATLTGAYAVVPVRDGSARVLNLALALSLAPGFEFSVD